MEQVRRSVFGFFGSGIMDTVRVQTLGVSQDNTQIPAIVAPFGYRFSASDEPMQKDCIGKPCPNTPLKRNRTAKLNGETARVNWHELQRFSRKGVVIARAESIWIW